MTNVICNFLDCYVLYKQGYTRCADFDDNTLKNPKIANCFILGGKNFEVCSDWFTSDLNLKLISLLIYEAYFLKTNFLYLKVFPANSNQNREWVQTLRYDNLYGYQLFFLNFKMGG